MWWGGRDFEIVWFSLLFFRWGNWGTEKQGEFPEVTWHGRIQTRTWAFCLLVFITSLPLCSSLISVLSKSLPLPWVSSSSGWQTGPAVCLGISSQSRSQTVCACSLCSLWDHYSTVWELWPGRTRRQNTDQVFGGKLRQGSDRQLHVRSSDPREGPLWGAASHKV